MQANPARENRVKFACEKLQTARTGESGYRASHSEPLLSRLQNSTRATQIVIAVTAARRHTLESEAAAWWVSYKRGLFPHPLSGLFYSETVECPLHTLSCST